MWALTSQPIRNSEALQMLERYRKHNRFQSNQWLLPRHLALFGVRPLYAAQLVLPTTTVIHQPLTAAPFSSLPASTQRQILNAHPPPSVARGRCVLLERTPDGPQWRAASVTECFDASFVHSSSALPHQHLLCSTDFQTASTIPEDVTVFNAQETSNPFFVDAGLFHRDLVTLSPLPHSISSALTTVAAQFRYTSFDWAPSPAADTTAQLRVRGSEMPHRIQCQKRLRLIHISQLPIEEQQSLVEALPRLTLVKSMTSSYLYERKRWRNYKTFGLTRPLLHADIPSSDTLPAPSLQPLLWVVLPQQGDRYRSKVVERDQQVRYAFYNSQQLDLSEPEPSE